MIRSISLIVTLTLCVLLTRSTQVEHGSGSPFKNEATTVSIALTELKVTDKILELRYNIRNDSKQDIWICEALNRFGAFEVVMAEDNETLLIRRRLDLPMKNTSLGDQPLGQYVRLCPGESHIESLLLYLPVRPRPMFWGRILGNDIKQVKRLKIEMGFYSGDLRGMIFSMLDEEEKRDKKPYVIPIYPKTIRDWFRGSLYFTLDAEGERNREEQVLIPWTDQTLKGEQVLRTTVDDILIPYSEDTLPPMAGKAEIEKLPKLLAQDVSHCTRIEIQYKPSMLEYFFPYESQKSLLSPAEKQYLQSLKTIVVDDQERIKAFADEIGEGADIGGIVTEQRKLDLVCYRNDERLTSFTVYDDTTIDSEEKRRFMYYHRGGLQSLKMLTPPQIQPFEFRVQCAKNLNDLWHRFRVYHKAEMERMRITSSKSVILYPDPINWCEAMVQCLKVAYQIIGPSTWIMKPHKCPSAVEGKCHYAMNPNCMPDSPPDTVLLFETKAGWNQHGGPELFTFDNHDPKGGCVLLNDGTVKFIRTQEELRQLRWK